MKIDLLDHHRLIQVNHLRQVTSPMLYANKKMIFDPNGILSNEIFGLSKGDRRSTFAYVDLKRHFLHPHIYSNILKRTHRNIMYIVSGQRKYKVINGTLVQADDGWTGLEQLYNHWDEINWTKAKMTAQPPSAKDEEDVPNPTTAKKLLASLTRDEAFVDVLIVSPPAYRDVMLSGTVDSSDHTNPVNEMYQQVIRMTSMLQEGGMFARTQYATQMKVQDKLVEIFDHYKDLIRAKNGLIRKNLMGKSVDFGTRAVISAPSYRHNRFEDNIVDLEHSALPISMCCSSFKPLIEAWLKNFFTSEVVNAPANLITFADPKSGKDIAGHIKDADVQFSERNITKLINDYMLNPDHRFTPIRLTIVAPTPTGDKTTNAVLMLKGNILLPNNAQKVLNRPMTLTDILYLAAVDVCEKRHIMVSRYPVGTDKGIYFASVRVQSTQNHVHLVYNGKDYPFYPDIDVRITGGQVGVQFIDTLVMSNSHLDGMGADYDGDTTSVRGIWSDEANLEAERIMRSKMSGLNITGKNSKGVAKEVFNSMYELTKLMPSRPSKDVSETDHVRLTSMKVSDITRDFLVEMLADTVDCSQKNTVKRRPAKYNTWDRMTVPAGYFYQGQQEIHTTIGRFIFNRFILEGAGCLQITHFLNETMNKGGLEDLDTKIGQYYMEDKIDRMAYNGYIDRRDTLGYWLNGMLAHTISPKMAKPLPEVEALKADLIKKNEKELAAGNIDVMTDIQNQLLAKAKEILKDDPGMDLYLSGDLDFANNYKNNSVVKGAVKNELTGEFDFISTSFMDGIKVEDLPAHANSILASQYPASIATADSGYVGKKLIALLQMMQVDEPGTDCGRKRLIPTMITKHNSKDMVYSYIRVGSQDVLLTPENVSGYIGKRVLLYSPESCLNTKICSKCAGQLFYMLEAKQAGLFSVQISHAALNLGLKAKHNSQVELFTLDPATLIQDL